MLNVMIRLKVVDKSLSESNNLGTKQAYIAQVISSHTIEKNFSRPS